jgi:hypothetical protein
VRATVPSVSSGEYAELRVTMPSSWLLGMDAVDEERLDTILQEGKGWAEETNARRTQARIIGASMRLFPRENYLKNIRGFYLQAN